MSTKKRLLCKWGVHYWEANNHAASWGYTIECAKCGKVRLVE